ncbi:hypothetical protein [Rhodococcus koreensis]
MGKIVSVPEGNVHHLIRQAYNAGGDYQWAREALVNSIQAQATWVNFGVDVESFEKHGVARRYVADNGLGMNREDIQLFLSSFGGGGKTISLTENFGQGFKSSCYEWNPYGIVVMSWTEDNPLGSMIWIYYDSGRELWRLKDFDIFYEDSDPDGDPDDISDCIPPEWNEELGIDLKRFHFEEIKKAGHGTVFLFLGDGPDRWTVYGDYKRGEDSSKRGIVGYLNKRFATIPEGVEVRVASLEAKAEDSERRDSKDRSVTNPSDDKRYTIHSRTVKGLRSFISPNHKHGELMVKHGTTIEWFLTDEDDIGRSGGYGPVKPAIAVQYEDEAYDYKDRPQAYRPFGITDALKNRIWLFITPPAYSEHDPTKWGVMPQASRGMLIGKGSTELPWSDWQDNFYQQLPGPIKQALLETQSGASEADTQDRRARLARVMDRLSTRFRPIMLVKNDKGRESGNESHARTGEPRKDTGRTHAPSTKPAKPRNPANPSGGAGPRVILNRDEAGEFAGSEQRRSEGTPNVLWDVKFEDEDDISHAAMFNPKEDLDGSFGTVHFNSSFPMFQNEFTFWSNEYPRADPSEVLDLVKTVYEDEIVARIMHAHKMKGQELAKDSSGRPVRIKDENIEAWTSPQALTAAVLGLVNVESRIRVTAGGRFGRGKQNQPKK